MDLGTLEKLVKFLDQSMIGVIVLDKDLTIKFVNNNYEVFFLNTFGLKIITNESLHDIMKKDSSLQKYGEIWNDVIGKGESFYDETNNFYGSVINHHGLIVGGYSIHSGVYSKTALKKSIKIANTENAVLERANHELRTPLVSIVGSAQLLDLTIPKTKDYEQYREHIKCILRSGEHLQSMIEDFMDFSRLAKNKLYLDISGKVNVESTIDKCIDIMKPQAEQYQVQLIVNKPNNVLDSLIWYIKGDANRFSQILINLISNGIKYNKLNGKVVVEYKEVFEKNCIKIDIIDTGVGISEEDIQTKLFKEYTRFGPKCNVVEGSGLGLALSKKLINLMNGKIYVKSKIDVGTRFTLVFKLEKSETPLATESECIYIVYCDPTMIYFKNLHSIISTRFDNKIKLLPALSVDIMKTLIDEWKPQLLLLNEVEPLDTNVPSITIEKPIEMEKLIDKIGLILQG